MTMNILENQRRLAAQQEAAFDDILNKLRSTVAYNDTTKDDILQRGDAIIAAVKEWQADSCARLDQASSALVGLINLIQGTPGSRHLEGENVATLPNRRVGASE